MDVIRCEINFKELADEHSAINTLPRSFLKSLGFDPDGEFTWWDDDVRGVRVITQKKRSA